MLEISRRNGTHVDPIVGPRLVSRECQTDEVPGDPTTSRSCFPPPGTAAAAAAAAGRSPAGSLTRGRAAAHGQSGLPPSPLSR